MQIGVITDPRSRKNRGHPERADRLQSIVGPFGEVHATASVDSIKPVLREFQRRFRASKSIRVTTRRSTKRFRNIATLKAWSSNGPRRT